MRSMNRRRLRRADVDVVFAAISPYIRALAPVFAAI